MVWPKKTSNRHALQRDTDNTQIDTGGDFSVLHTKLDTTRIGTKYTCTRAISAPGRSGDFKGTLI